MILSHQPHRPVAHAAAAAGALLSALSLVTVGTGLLYLLTPLAPRVGPSVSDALPLDELPGHAGAPILLFALVWAAAAWATCAVAPRAQFTLTTTTIFWARQIVLDTASLGIVRQVHFLSALPAALSTPAPYLAAAIATVVSKVQTE
jgi:hypothetical protein